MAVPNTFASATSPIPLANLDANFAYYDAAINASGANLVFQGLQSTGQTAPTIASATTIAPTTTIAFVSGTTAIATITPPTPISLTGGQITLIPTGLFTTTTTGNIALASVAVVNKALILTYNQGTAKWYPSY